MNKMGLGSFADGLSRGFNTTVTGIASMQKARREQAEFDKQEAFENDLKEALSPIMQDMAAMQSGEPVQADGAVQGGLQAPTQGEAAPTRNGLQSAPGATAAPAAYKPLDLADISRRYSDAFLSVGFKHGKVSLEQLKAARDLRKELDKENVDEAVQTWLMTGDKNKVAEIFNKGGKVKFDPATMDIQTIKDPDGLLPANVVVTQRGPDGKPREVFNYEQLSMAGISREAYAQLVQSGKTTKLKEKGDTYRTAMQTQATLNAARIREGGNTNPEVSALQKKMDSEFKAIFQAAGYALNPREEAFLRGEVGKVARDLIEREGNNMETAYWRATQAVFKKNGIPIDLSKISR